jgi:hypothetical protein
MYRHATLRLPCESCGTEQPVPAMALSAHGGHICWKCQVGKQVDEHLASSARLQAQRRVSRGIANVVLGIIGGAGVLLAAIFAIAMLVVGVVSIATTLR